MKQQTNIIRFQAFTVLAGFVLMVAKFAAYFLTHSNAILTDALESIVNVLAGAFAWYSLRLAAKPRDQEHPYGHGKIEFISASVEGALISIAGLMIIGKSVYNFFVPQAIHDIDVGLYLTAAAGILNFVMGYTLVKAGKRKNSLTLQANGEHLMSDAYSTVGLVAGLLLIWISGLLWIDNIMGLVFGGIILFSGFRILRRSVAGIMDEADFEVLSNMIEVLNEERRKDWVDIHNLRVIRYGANMHVDAHMTLPWYYSLQKAHDTISDVDRLVSARFGGMELFIHMDPCIPSSCKICRLENCPERTAPFSGSLEWTMENLLRNQKHGS